MDKTLALLLGITVLAAAGGLYLYDTTQQYAEEDYYRTQFSEWKRTYNRKYGAEEDEYRLQVFSNNLKAINEHNEKFSLGDSTFELGLNHFGDLTTEEYEARYLTLMAQPPKSGIIFDGEGVEAPEELNWVEKGAVNAVKNQGSCGSCWAFSTVGAVEGRLFLKDGTLPNLSEQELVDCAGGEYQNEGCNGGLMDNAFKYIIDHGITTEEAYPYSGRDATCKQNVQPRYTLTGYTDVKVGSEQALVAAISQQPVSVAINAGSMWFQFYKSGVFKRSCSAELNHGVVAVGYGTQGSDNYYLVRNSWGPSWGDKGYIKMVRNGEGDGECGIQDAASFPQ